HSPAPYSTVPYPPALYEAGLHSRRALLALGDLLIAWLLCRQAELAARAAPTARTAADRHFYDGKRAVARFFTREVLPRLAADRATVAAADASAMALRAEAF
ncbi:acyl-CoA dehydrogenase C-terminal domain-containing protein, partial [Streptomyces pathocidini]